MKKEKHKKTQKWREIYSTKTRSRLGRAAMKEWDENRACKVNNITTNIDKTCVSIRRTEKITKTYKIHSAHTHTTPHKHTLSNQEFIFHSSALRIHNMKKSHPIVEHKHVFSWRSASSKVRVATSNTGYTASCAKYLERKDNFSTRRIVLVY